MNPIDEPRPVAPSYDRLPSEYSVTIEEAVLRYAHAGHPRTPRSVQRYCANGHLECRLVETAFGEKYKIAPASIDRHIAFIEEVRPVVTSLAETRPVVMSQPQFQQAFTERKEPTSHFEMPRHAITSNEEPRQESSPVMPINQQEIQKSNFNQPSTSQDMRGDLTRQDVTSHADVREGSGVQNHVQPIHAEQETRKEEPQQIITPPAPTPMQDKMIELLEKENNFLRNQISTKDEQIKDLTERARETNHLIGGLQRMLTPLLGSGGQQRDEERQEGERKRFWQGS